MSSEWQTIESAPKDGSDVLIWSKDSGTIIASWDEKFSARKPPEYKWVGSELDDGYYTGYNPTHWMSLPTPLSKG